MRNTLVKAEKSSLEKYLGWKLAADVTSHFFSDFVDEDTNEFIRIERNILVAKKGTVITRPVIEAIDKAEVYAVAVY